MSLCAAGWPAGWLSLPQGDLRGGGQLSYEDSKYLGGDVAHTHLVKGLDFALLHKVRCCAVLCGAVRCCAVRCGWGGRGPGALAGTALLQGHKTCSCSTVVRGCRRCCCCGVQVRSEQQQAGKGKGAAGSDGDDDDAAPVLAKTVHVEKQQQVRVRDCGGVSRKCRRGGRAAGGCRLASAGLA